MAYACRKTDNEFLPHIILKIPYELKRQSKIFQVLEENTEFFMTWNRKNNLCRIQIMLTIKEKIDKL